MELGRRGGRDSSATTAVVQMNVHCFIFKEASLDFRRDAEGSLFGAEEKSAGLSD